MARRTMTLLGPDVLLVAWAVRRPNNAVLVLECAGVLDAGRVERALDATPADCALHDEPAGASVSVGPAPLDGGRRGRPAGARRRLAPDESLEGVDRRLLNELVDPRRAPPLRWHVRRGTRRPDELARARRGCIRSWIHAARSCSSAMLDARRSRRRARQPGLRRGRSSRRRIRRPLRERGALARGGDGPRCRRSARQRLRSSPATATAAGRVRHRAGVVGGRPRQLPQTLAAVGRAVAATASGAAGSRRGRSSCRSRSTGGCKGEPGPVFGNFLSFHFARLHPGQMEDPRRPPPRSVATWPRRCGRTSSRGSGRG